jgi:hypothetical protein
MKRFVVMIFFALDFSSVFGQKLTEMDVNVISNFIGCVKSNDRIRFSNMILFPLDREYPIPAIRDKEEFLKRYDDLFDKHLIEMIVSSSSTKDWSEMGWRGLMFRDGLLWLDSNGKLIALNYQSSSEKIEIQKLITTEKSNLHKSVSKFKRPIYLLETSKHKIRIDDLGNGNYRYAAWFLTRKMSEKPDVIIENGEYVPDGSGGNHSYVFRHQNFVYKCTITIFGEANTPSAWLRIYKDDKEISSKRAKLIMQ